MCRISTAINIDFNGPVWFRDAIPQRVAVDNWRNIAITLIDGPEPHDHGIVRVRFVRNRRLSPASPSLPTTFERCP